MTLASIQRRPAGPSPRRPALAASAPTPSAQAEVQAEKHTSGGVLQTIGHWLSGLFSPAPAPLPPAPPAPPVPPAPHPQPRPSSPPPTLRRSAQGPLVLLLQQKLSALGFNVGVPDGMFGAGTEAAVKDFQRAAGLPADGVVGPGTWAALGVRENPLPPPPALKPGAPAIDVAGVARLLNIPAANLRANWPYLANAMAAAGMTDRASVIAVIATIRTEAGNFEPINEWGGPSYWARYNGRADLGNRPGLPDGVTYHGRGYIQLTGRANYIKYGDRLGVDLVNQPALALDPDVAARVLVAYAQSHSIPGLARKGDWEGVRRAVNGGLNGWTTFIGAVTALRSHTELLG